MEENQSEMMKGAFALIKKHHDDFDDGKQVVLELIKLFVVIFISLSEEHDKLVGVVLAHAAFHEALLDAAGPEIEAAAGVTHPEGGSA